MSAMRSGGVLDAAGHAHQVGGDPGGGELRVVHLPVGGRGGVQATGAGVGHVGLDGGQAQVLHKLLRRLASALHAEGDHAAGAIGHILLGDVVILVPLQAGIGDPGPPWGCS